MIKKTISDLISKFKTNDPFILCEYLNIRVLKTNLGNTDGFYQKVHSVEFITLNSDRNDIIQRYVCAHELGHAVLHSNMNVCFLKNSTFYNLDKYETQANKFAIELLLPDKIVDSYSEFEYSIHEIAKIENVPAELLAYKYFT